MPGLGEKLREAREKMGLSVKEVEQRINFKSSYIQALEEEDFSALPDKKYVLDILKAYAGFLNLDIRETVGEFNRAWADAAAAKAYIRETFSGEERTSGSPAGYKRVMAIGIFLVALFIIIGVNWLKPASYSDGGRVAHSDGSAGQEQAADTEKIPGSVTNSAERNSFAGNLAGEVVPGKKEGTGQKEPEEVREEVQVEISTPRGDCWLEVVVDGKTVLYRTVWQGEKPLIFRGEKKVRVVFGNAAAVDVTCNGTPLGSLGNEGQVVRKVFTP